ncbi:50S ribosomal protein L25 [Chloroflexota bacterium]
MEKIELHANKRDILGKKVRFLRRQGITPVHLFGHNIESMALQCDTMQLRHSTSQAGRTQLISLKIDKSRKSRMVMIKEVQTEIMTGNLLHVDLYQVTMTEKISVELPITLVGEAPAEKSKSNMLVHELSSLTIEALPGAIPESVEVDISSLSALGQVIRVGDIQTGEEVTVLSDPEQVVIRIIARPAAKGEGVAEEEEAPTTEEQPQDE